MPRSARLAVLLHVAPGQPWSELVAHDVRARLARHAWIAPDYADPGVNGASQAALLDAALGRGVDAVLLQPMDVARVGEVLQRHRARGTPVVLMDQDLGDPDLYSALVVADNRRIGREVGVLLSEALGREGTLAEVQGPIHTPVPCTSASDRSAGFREALTNHPRLRLVDTCRGDWTYDQAREAFGHLLVRQRRLDAVFAHNDVMARAALDAAAAVGREEELLVVGVDALRGEHGGARLVAEGRLAATFLNPSPAKEAVHALVALLGGEPVLKRTLLRTSSLVSQARVRRWQERRKQ